MHRSTEYRTVQGDQIDPLYNVLKKRILKAIGKRSGNRKGRTGSEGITQK